MSVILTLLTIAAIWIAAAIFVAVIFHFCLSPRRMEKHRLTHPMPSGSLDHEVRL